MGLRETIAAYRPVNEQETADQALMLCMIDRFPDTILARECPASHLTASGFVVNEKRDKALMVYHNIYQSWSWTGGHADGDCDLLAVAMREAKEETGITRLRPLCREIAGLDVLGVTPHRKHGAYISAHLHLTASFLLEAPEDQPLAEKPDENSAVGWILLAQLAEYVTERHMLPVYQKLMEKLKSL
ncbi:NUDIX domain-containing protein [Anaerotruncus sp. AF02-27]|jgi:8-oxo-dGTP pyrophosphatase MutT (NUDIX family)|uniref:NUDIX hydrolase n=1 Tax=Anaerotruncus TaxID=244127 RepID=UPI000E4AD838|nr:MULTISPECIES: NUDIX hydrolase [Anaerotruncus]RGX54409.1 NUDIX domain-containing protein [Anaerotruncus sp. AF02-27]